MYRYESYHSERYTIGAQFERKILHVIIFINKRTEFGVGQFWTMCVICLCISMARQLNAALRYEDRKCMTFSFRVNEV